MLLVSRQEPEVDGNQSSRSDWRHCCRRGERVAMQTCGQAFSNNPGVHLRLENRLWTFQVRVHGCYCSFQILLDVSLPIHRQVTCICIYRASVDECRPDYAFQCQCGQSPTAQKVSSLSNQKLTPAYKTYIGLKQFTIFDLHHLTFSTTR